MSWGFFECGACWVVQQTVLRLHAVRQNGKKSLCERCKTVPEEENKQRTVGCIELGWAEGGFLDAGLPGCCVLLRWARAQNQRKRGDGRRVCVCSTLSLPMTGGILTGSAVAVTSHKSASAGLRSDSWQRALSSFHSFYPRLYVSYSQNVKCALLATKSEIKSTHSTLFKKRRSIKSFLHPKNKNKKQVC